MKIFTKEELPNYLKTRPKKTSGSGMVLRDTRGYVLVLKTCYHEGMWTLPGGGAEKYETPQETAERETFEEIGLNIDAKDFLLLDTVIHKEIGEDGFNFYFDGGYLTQDQVNNIRLAIDEIDEYRFIDPKNYNIVFEPDVAPRIPYVFNSLDSRTAHFMVTEK